MPTRHAPLSITLFLTLALVLWGCEEDYTYSSDSPDTGNHSERDTSPGEVPEDRTDAGSEKELDDVETEPDADDVGRESDSGDEGDAATDTHDATPPTVPLVELQLAGGVTHTNDRVEIVAIVRQGSPEWIELRYEGGHLAFLDDTLRYEWATNTVDEGPHELYAVVRGGGHEVETDPITVVVDRTKPSVVSTSPSGTNATHHVRAPIVVDFSEPIHPATLTSDTVQFTLDGSPADYTHELSPDGLTLTVMPVTPPAAPAEARLVVTTDVTDRAGNTLALRREVGWAYPLWLPEATDLRLTANQNLYFNDIISDADGNLYLSVRDDDGLHLLVRPDGHATWQTIATYAPESPQHTFAGATMTLTSDGTLWLARIENPTGGVSDYHYHVSYFDGTQMVEAGGALNATPAGVAPAVMLVGGEHPTSVYTHRENSFTRVLAAAWDGTEWKPQGGDANSREQTGFTIGAARINGQPAAIWRELVSSSPSRYEIVMRRYNGSNWQNMSSRVNLQASSSTVDAPSVACTAGGACVAAFYEYDDANQRISIFARRFDGIAWRTLGASLNASQTPAPNAVQVTLDSDGIPYVAWRTWESSNGLQTHNYVAHWEPATESWTRLGEALNNVATNRVGEPRIVIDRDGNPLVAFSETNTNTNLTAVNVKRLNR